MDIEKLKQKILDLAIRGKLVPQDPNDEPASVLIVKIRNEKEELIKQGKIKRDKNESYIYKGSDNCYYEKIGNEVKNITEELPFVIPDNWTWCRLKSIISLKSGDSIKVTGLGNNGKFPVYGGNGINGYFDQFNVPSNTIIIGRVGFYCGSIHVTKLNSWVTDNALIVAHNNIINVNCLSIFLKALNLSKTSNSTAQPVVSGKGILPLFCPLPPFNEQLKIINQYDKIISKISFLQKDSNELNDIINLSKIKILDYYYGENSCYKSYFMNKNKEHLKNFIPSKYIGDGDWVLSENMDPNGDYKLIQLKHIGNNQYLNKPYNTVSKEFVNQNNCSIIKSGTLLINRLVADKMNCCILPETIYNHITSVDVCWIAKNDSIDNEYLMYLLSSPSFQTEVMNKCSGSTRKRISKKNLLDIKVFIHNYEYQLIIKTKIQEIFCLLDSISI